MKNNHSPFARPQIRILLSVVLLALCFLMNRFFKIEKAPWSLLQFGLSVVLILVAATCILKAISQLTLAKKQATEKPKFDPEHPVKIWTHEELFNYLEADDMVDLVIDHEGGCGSAPPRTAAKTNSPVNSSTLTRSTTSTTKSIPISANSRSNSLRSIPRKPSAFCEHLLMIMM